MDGTGCFVSCLELEKSQHRTCCRTGSIIQTQTGHNDSSLDFRNNLLSGLSSLSSFLQWMGRPGNCAMVVVVESAGFTGSFLFKFARVATVNSGIPLGHLMFVAFIYGANGLCTHIQIHMTTIDKIYRHIATQTHGHTHTLTHYLCL